MIREAPHLEIEVTFLKAEEGGKTRPFRQGYRPAIHHHGRYGDAFYQFEADDWIRPGDTVRARVTLLCPELHQDVLRPGEAIELCEGAHVYARGRVLRVFPAAEDGKTMPSAVAPPDKA
jgi:translation elongation factor EF-Tu-like GTPase